MALVSYDFGSDSGENDTDEDTLSVNTEAKDSEAVQKAPDDNTSELFLKLPKTKTVFQDVQEDKIEDFIPKVSVTKERQKVKITIPSLSQFEDEDEDEPKEKKIKPSAKASGLMSLLPPVKTKVKTEKMFVPHVIANKSRNTSTSKRPVVKNSRITTKSDVKNTEKSKRSFSDVESDDDIDIPETFDDEIWQKVCSRQKQSKPVVQEITEASTEPIVNLAPEPDQPYDGLDNKAFKELLGKTKRPIGNIKLIDINEEEILPDKDLWLTKSLTDPEMAPKDTAEDPVDPTRRKKHHITYLAQQAKANEKELQSAWSASKNNRLMSRAKYGF